MKTQFPFENLVFRGGGVLGIAYLGALKVLDSEEILTNIKRVSGASAGAITALITALCDNADEIRTIANSLDFSKVPDKRDDKKHLTFSKEHKHELGSIIDDLACVKRLINQYGWYSSEYFYNWLKTVIQNQFNKKGNIGIDIKNKAGLQTFADFKTAGFKDIYISVTNISQRKNEIFSAENTISKDMPLADAVRMSMSIPLYFESIEFNGDRYADGGTVNNYPIEVFDDIRYVSDKSMFVDQINKETLGCHLFSKNKVIKPHKDNLVHYIEDLFLTLLQVQTIEFEKSPNIIERSANIDDLGISPVDFDITVDDEDPFREPLPNAPYDELYRSGFMGMAKYLEEYRSW